MSTEKTPEQLAADVQKKFDDAVNVVREIAEKATTEAGNGVKMSQSATEKADAALTKMNELGEELRAVKQQLANVTVKRSDEPPQSLGEQFVSAENVKTFLAQTSPRGRVDLTVKTTITTAPGSAGSLIEPTRLPGIVAPPDRRLVVRDLITPGNMGGNTIEYVRETGFTNAAAPVAEEAKKPESGVTFDDVSTSAKVIAHFIKVSRQALSDAPQLRSYVDGRLMYGLAYKEESQLLNGDGTGQNLLGIIPQAVPFTPSLTLPVQTSIDVLRLAMLQAVLAQYPATGHVMNPIDWAWIETLKDTTGRYIIGNPQGSINPTLWSLPVVQTPAIAEKKFLTGAFKLGAQLFDRWQARVELATENEDDFVKNRITLLAEERLALAVYRPECFIYGDFVRDPGP